MGLPGTGGAPLEVARHVPYTWRGINGPDWEYGKEQSALATRAEILWERNEVLSTWLARWGNAQVV